MSYDIYLALAEEASELSKAAAKQARLLIGHNPSPVSHEDNDRNVLEELADVYVCANVLYGSTKDDYVSATMNTKLARWVSRLSGSCTDAANTSVNTGYVDALDECVRVGDTLFGSTDNKQWKVVGTAPDLSPYTLCVQDKKGVTKNVKPKWMAHNAWSFGTYVDLSDGRSVLPGTQCYLFGTVSPVTLVSHNKDVACVKRSNSNSCDVVPLRSLSFLYWDSYNNILSDMTTYRHIPEKYFEKFGLAKTGCDTVAGMVRHLSERLSGLCANERP